MTIAWLHDPEQAREQAQRLRRPVLLDVYKVP